MPDTVVDSGNLRVRQYWPLPGRAPILEGEINAQYNRALSDPGRAEVGGSSGRREVWVMMRVSGGRGTVWSKWWPQHLQKVMCLVSVWVGSNSGAYWPLRSRRTLRTLDHILGEGVMVWTLEPSLR